MTKHTPTPWRVSSFEQGAAGSARVIMGEDGFSIAHVMDRTPAENEADAALIVEAVNAYDALLRRVTVLEMVIRQDLQPVECSDDLNKMIVEDIHKRFSTVDAVSRSGSAAMSDRKGDPAKQPPECESRFTPSAHNPRLGVWSQCPNLRETSSSSDMDGETYDCDVCGKHYRLYYEDMA